MVRVNYDSNNWDLIQSFLLDVIEYSKINILTRVRLISDMFALAEAGELLYNFVFRTMNYLTYEEHFQPWKVALEQLDLIRTRLVGTNIFESYQVCLKSSPIVLINT